MRESIAVVCGPTVAPALTSVAPRSAVPGSMRASCADPHVHVDPRGERVHDRHPGAHVPLEDRALGERAHLRERHLVVDTEHEVRVLDGVGGTVAPSARSRSSTCGRYSSPWALSALRRGSAASSASPANA